VVDSRSGFKHIYKRPKYGRSPTMIENMKTISLYNSAKSNICAPGDDHQGYPNLIHIYICIYIKFCVQKCYAGNRPPCDDHQGYPNLIHIYICIYIKFCVQKCYAGNRPPGDDHQGYPNLIHIYIYVVATT
jgi:hypothetical protein